MKAAKSTIVILSLLLGMAGCQKSNVVIPDIIGCWVNPVYVDNTEGKSIVFFEKSAILPEQARGIQFYNDGTLIERKNGGWCGTPPISYSDFSGNWQVQKNGNIRIDVAYWGGMEHNVWKIIEITNTTLQIEAI